jgi:hypothetical protein
MEILLFAGGRMPPVAWEKGCASVLRTAPKNFEKFRSPFAYRRVWRGALCPLLPIAQSNGFAAAIVVIGIGMGIDTGTSVPPTSVWRGPECRRRAFCRAPREARHFSRSEAMAL